MSCWRWLVLPLLAGCSAKSLTGEQACDQVKLEIQARTQVCTGDKALAERAAESLDHLECYLEDQDTAIAHASSDLVECLGAIHSADCEAVAVHAELADFWLNLAFHCPRIFGEPRDSGLVQ